MTLADDIVSDVTDVFLNTDDFAVSAEFWPEGAAGSMVTTTVVVNADWLPGTNEAPGDGVLQNRDGQRRERKSIDVYAPATLTVNDTQDETRRDKIKPLAGPFSGTVLVVQRVLGEDAGMYRLRCIIAGNIGRTRFERTG